MSKQPKNLNAVFGRLRRRMLAAQLSTEAVGRRNIRNASEPARRTMPATPPEPPPRLPGRALGEYAPGGRPAGPHVMLGTRDGHRVEFHVQFRVVRRGRAGPINRGLTRRPDGGRGASAVADAPSAPARVSPPCSPPAIQRGGGGLTDCPQFRNRDPATLRVSHA